MQDHHPHGFRQMLEELADMAVLLLDELDADPDLEPWLAGSPSSGATSLDLEGDDADDEPSLGSREDTPNQTGWAMGHPDHREEEHDGREPDDADYEPDHDREPSLGSIDHVDQTAWADGEPNGYDYEHNDCDDEPDDNGIGDLGGLREQTGRTGTFAGNGICLTAADEVAVALVRLRLAAILDGINAHGRLSVGGQV